MARPVSDRFPPYPSRAHSSGQARIKVAGRTLYLGVFGSAESWTRYRQLLGEWQTARSSGMPGPEVDRAAAANLVRDLAALYVTHAETIYRRATDGKPGSELRDLRLSLAPLLAMHGSTPVSEFGPLALKAVQMAMATGTWLSDDQRAARVKAGASLTVCRKTTNQRIKRIKKMFKWGVSEELIPESVYHRLVTVEGLKRGRTAAVDYPDVPPAPEGDVDAVLPFLGPVTRAMVTVQRLTGMRPGELCALTPGEIDRTIGDCAVWVYRPAAHKTAWHGHTRAIVFGPLAQAVLTPLLEGRAADVPIFSPVEEIAGVRAERRAKAKSPRAARQTRGVRRTRADAGARAPRAAYDSQSYGRRIHKACKRAGVPPWTPHQLRHLAEVKIERAYGLDAARAVLGHRDCRMTIRYGAQDLETAAKVAAAMG